MHHVGLQASTVRGLTCLGRLCSMYRLKAILVMMIHHMNVFLDVTSSTTRSRVLTEFLWLHVCCYFANWNISTHKTKAMHGMFCLLVPMIISAGFAKQQNEQWPSVPSAWLFSTVLHGTHSHGWIVRAVIQLIWWPGFTLWPLAFQMILWHLIMPTFCSIWQMLLMLGVQFCAYLIPITFGWRRVALLLPMMHSTNFWKVSMHVHSWRCISSDLQVSAWPVNSIYLHTRNLKFSNYLEMKTANGFQTFSFLDAKETKTWSEKCHDWYGGYQVDWHHPVLCSYIW